MIANDPDNAMTPSGMLSFRIQDDIEDASAFKIGKIDYDKLEFDVIQILFLFD